MREKLDLIRMGVLIVLGSVLVVWSLIDPHPTTLMLGFAVLGVEPMARAKPMEDMEKKK